MIIPPTIRNTSNEMPKMLKTLSPISAEVTRITRMVSATLAASHRLCANASFGVSVKKIEPHTTGQNGHDCLHHVVKARIEMRSKVERHWGLTEGLSSSFASAIAQRQR